MIPRKILDKEKLEELYMIEKLSPTRIGALMSVSEGCVRNNLKYFDCKIRNRSEARKGKSPWCKGLTKEVHESLMSISIKMAKSQKGKIPVNKGELSNKKILLKVCKEQPHISTDYDLSAFGYRMITKRKNGAIDWILRKYENARIRIKRKENPEKFREWGRRNYQNHKESFIKRAKEYSKTPKGKILRAKTKYKHNQKGFVPLNTLIDIPSDWHHLHPQLPFVLSIDREIHRKYNGKIHYDSVNAEIGLTEIVGKSKEDIEYYIELNYPEEFKIYWFGDY